MNESIQVQSQAASQKFAGAGVMRNWESEAKQGSSVTYTTDLRNAIDFASGPYGYGDRIFNILDLMWHWDCLDPKT